MNLKIKLIIICAIVAIDKVIQVINLFNDVLPNQAAQKGSLVIAVNTGFKGFTCQNRYRCSAF